jgi:hypothetical protein
VVFFQTLKADILKYLQKRQDEAPAPLECTPSRATKVSRRKSDVHGASDAAPSTGVLQGSSQPPGAALTQAAPSRPLSARRTSQLVAAVSGAAAAGGLSSTAAALHTVPSPVEAAAMDPAALARAFSQLHAAHASALADLQRLRTAIPAESAAASTSKDRPAPAAPGQLGLPTLGAGLGVAVALLAILLPVLWWLFSGPGRPPTAASWRALQADGARADAELDKLVELLWQRIELRLKSGADAAPE